MQAYVRAISSSYMLPLYFWADSVQEVVTRLRISRIEARDDEDPDVRGYVHAKVWLDTLCFVLFGPQALMLR
jgi:hypothetical protein